MNVKEANLSDTDTFVEHYITRMISGDPNKYREYERKTKIFINRVTSIGKRENKRLTIRKVSESFHDELIVTVGQILFYLDVDFTNFSDGDFYELAEADSIYFDFLKVSDYTKVINEINKSRRLGEFLVEFNTAYHKYTLSTIPYSQKTGYIGNNHEMLEWHENSDAYGLKLFNDLLKSAREYPNIPINLLVELL